MPKFTTRIVLHDADSDDYDDLYEYMDEEGFTDEIASSDGTKYKMPDAEYDISCQMALKDVMAKAKRAAGKTGKEYQVFITESARRQWVGLEKA